MPRIARVVAPGVPHHVTQRGNRREDVFFEKSDRRTYLGLLQEYAERNGLEIVAYCLMSNHVHLVVIPEKEESLASTLRPVHLRYTQWVNKRRGETGILWQGRFFSCPLDDDHYWNAIRYVERNPVRAKLVERAEDFSWSSAAARCGLIEDALLMELEGSPFEPSEWAAWLEDPDDVSMIERLRQRTRTGRPAGSAAFIERIEHALGRALRLRKAGRPRKLKRT
jgi:putative transposase